MRSAIWALPTPSWARPAAPSSSLNEHCDRARDRRPQGRRRALGNLGLAYADLGETRRAIEFYEQALQIAREIGDRRGAGSALWNMALALGQLEDRAQAIVRAEAALAIYEQIESPHAEMMRNRLAEWKAGDGADQR